MGATKCQKSNSPLFESLKPPQSESWKPVEKSSLWISSLNKLHWARTLCCCKDQGTPEKPSNTEVLQLLQTIRSIFWQEIRASSRSTSFPRLQKVSWIFSLRKIAVSLVKFYFCLKFNI